jgi:GxxExxY protein
MGAFHQALMNSYAVSGINSARVLLMTATPITENAMELIQLGLKVKTQVPLPVIYKENKLELGFRIDVLVDNTVIIEVKSVEFLHDVHKKQLLTYLKLSDKKLGILVNFNVHKLEDKISLIRIIN